MCRGVCGGVRSVVYTPFFPFPFSFLVSTYVLHIRTNCICCFFPLSLSLLLDCISGYACMNLVWWMGGWCYGVEWVGDL